jgi:hyperosmotically inducible periplasmic protein
MYFPFLIAYSILALQLTGESGPPIRVSNSQVVAEIEDHLYHANVLRHGHVEVKYADGLATLRGTVDSLGVKNDAETAAWKDEDVSRVVNDLVVTTESDPGRIVSEARRRIVNYYANSIFDHIHIDGQGNKLIVGGEVTEPFKKEAIGNFLSHIPGVAAIENNIQVLPLSTTDEELRMRVARAIYDDPYFANYAETAHPTIHIIVSADVVTLAGTVNSDFDKSRAGQDARLVFSDVPVQNDLRLVGQEGQ